MNVRTVLLVVLRMVPLIVSGNACSPSAIVDTCSPCGNLTSHTRPSLTTLNRDITRLKNKVDRQLTCLGNIYEDIYEVNTMEYRPSISECCNYESFLDYYNLSPLTEMTSFHSALTDVASLVNDVLTFEGFTLEFPFVNNVNIALCRLQRYFRHADSQSHDSQSHVVPPSSCQRTSNLHQCTSCSTDCQVKIAIDYLYSASYILEQVHSDIRTLHYLNP